MDDKKIEFVPICHRCEHRIKWIETKTWRPRYECGDEASAKAACYMYKPVRPVVLQKMKGDPRPQFGPPMISSRSYGVKLSDMVLTVMKEKGGYTLCYMPAKLIDFIQKEGGYVRLLKRNSSTRHNSKIFRKSRFRKNAQSNTGKKNS